MSTYGSFIARPSLFDLPGELLLDIVSHLPRPLAPYSTICKEFQILVECRIFKKMRFLWIEFPQKFNEIFALHHRQEALRSLCVLFTDDNIEFEEYKPTWGEAIESLVHELNSWNNLQSRSANLDLALLHSCTLRGRGCHHDSGSMDDSRRGASIKIAPIYNAANLASIPFVKGLAFSSYCPSRCFLCNHLVESAPPSHCLEHSIYHTTLCFDPVDIIQLGTKFPSLRSLTLDGLDMGHSATRHPRLLSKSQNNRIALGKYIQKLPEINTRLTTLRLQFYEDRVLNHTFIPLSLVPLKSGPSTPNTSLDPLSLALHTLSRECVNLRSLNILGFVIVGPELFWPPPSSSSSSQELTWPKLEEYILEINDIAPDGQWYSSTATADISNESTEEEPARNDDDLRAIENYSKSEKVTLPTRFNREKLIPLLRAITTSVNHMPKIQKFDLILDSETFQTTALDVGINGHGAIPSRPPKCPTINRRRWYTSFEWEEALQQGFIPEDIENGWKEWVGADGLIRVQRSHHEEE